MHKHKAFIIPTSDSYVDPPLNLESASDEPPPLSDTSTESTDDEGAGNRNSCQDHHDGCVDRRRCNKYHCPPGRVASNLPGRPYAMLDRLHVPLTVFDTGATTPIVSSMGALSTGGNEHAALEVASAAAITAGVVAVTTDNACFGSNVIDRPAVAPAPLYHERPDFKALLTAKLVKATYVPKGD
jgi:hypothetical protein